VYSRTAAALIRRMPLPEMAQFGSALMVIGFALMAYMPTWIWAAAGCAIGGFGFYLFHSTLQVNATQLSTTTRGVAVSLFVCSSLMGQSAGVALAAFAFTRLPSAVCFGTSSVVVAVLGLSQQLRTRQLVGAESTA
jgi:hypothetical protein